MHPSDDPIEVLRAAVALAPRDAFHRCNLACSLAAAGEIDEALAHLGEACSLASTPIMAGCVAAAVRDVADCISRRWSLPLGAQPPLAAIA